MTSIVQPKSIKNEDLFESIKDSVRAIQDINTRDTLLNSFDKTYIDSNVDNFNLGTMLYNNTTHKINYVSYDPATKKNIIKEL